MEEKKQEDNQGVETNTGTETTSATSLNTENTDSTEIQKLAQSNVVEANDAMVNEMSQTAVDNAEDSTTPVGKSFNLKAYVGAVVAIIIIFGGLIFVLEKEGRISTGLFTGLISQMDARKPAAKVNDVAITKSDYQSSLEQLSDMSAAQGADLSDAATLEALKEQTIETLVNAEVLRQAALDEGLTASNEDIDGRYNEISEGLGGAEALAAKMAEFGVTEAALKRDIENEFLIQQLFDLKVFDSVEVTDTEVQELYDQAVLLGNELPPLEEIREAIVDQIRNEKAQPLINDYIEELRNEADIEILI